MTRRRGAGMLGGMRGDAAESAAAERGADEPAELEQAFQAETSGGEAEDAATPGDPGAGPRASDGDPPARERTQVELEREVAALLFASTEPLSSARLASLCGDAASSRVSAALQAVRERLERSGLPFELRAIAGGFQLFTSPDMAPAVAALARARRDEKLSPAGLETLSVVAYRQPVTKAEIEVIRGVLVGPILRTLVDRGLVRVVGRSEDPGRALFYGTTRRFLDLFGLASLSELPRDAELLKD